MPHCKILEIRAFGAHHLTLPGRSRRAGPAGAAGRPHRRGAVLAAGIAALAVTGAHALPALADDRAGVLRPWPERYQLLIVGAVASLVALIAVTVAIAAVILHTHAAQELMERERRHRTRSVAAALKGEILAARAQYKRFLDTLRAIEPKIRARAAAEDADAPSDLDMRRWIPPVSDRVFGSIAGNIGLLGSQPAYDVADLYARFANLAESRHVAQPVTNQAMPRVLAGLIGDVEAGIARIDIVVRSLEDIERQTAVTPPRRLF